MSHRDPGALHPLIEMQQIQVLISLAQSRPSFARRDPGVLLIRQQFQDRVASDLRRVFGIWHGLPPVRFCKRHLQPGKTF